MKKYVLLAFIVLAIILISFYDWPDKGHFVSIADSYTCDGSVFKSQNGEVYLKGFDSDSCNDRETYHYIEEIYNPALNQFRVVKKIPGKRGIGTSSPVPKWESFPQTSDKFKFKIPLNNGNYLILYPMEVKRCKIADKNCQPTPAHQPQLISTSQANEDKWYYYAEKAEIYDPFRKGTIVIKPPHYKGHETATKLKNGKILLTGGMEHPFSLRWFTLFSDCDFPSGAEVFDPETNFFKRTGSMIVARERHIATILNNGKVLITGGRDCTSCDSNDNLCSETSNAELYIPE